MTDDPNVALVRRWFDAAAAGDVERTLGMLAPGLRYYGYDRSGEAREFRGRDDFFAMGMDAVAHTDEFTTELVHVLPVGETLVMAHARAHRRARRSGETVDDDFVIAFRIDVGQITHGIDLCGPALLEFWRRVSSA
jgi:ketosteroid isomerase-like protein